MSQATEKKFINLNDLRADLERRGFTITENNNSALTAPADKDVPLPGATVGGKKTKKKAKLAFQMNQKELEEALNKMTTEFPKIEKTWADPAIQGQEFCLVSFLPAKGATPDKDGLYGLIKVRGSYGTVNECDDRCERLLMESDSYHEICRGSVGKPLPLSHPDDDRFTLEVDHVNLQKKIQMEISDDVKEKRKKEKQEMDEAKARSDKIQQKEKTIIEHGEDPEEKYTTFRVKRANLIFSLYELLKNAKKYKDTLLQTIGAIEKMDTEFPQFQHTFMAKYNNAAKEVGIPTEKNFILRYLAGPVPFDLKLIPDELPLIDTRQSEISFFNEDLVNPHTVAEKMAKETDKREEKGSVEDQKAQ